MTIVARAPGKLFLLGEYAVLDGAPAIVAGVDRFVEVRLTRRATPTVRLTAADRGDAIAFAAGRPPDHPPLRFALAAYAEAVASCPPLASAGFELDIRSDLELDRATLPCAAELATDAGERRAKLGLGSSAAVTVAITAAMLAAAGIDGPAPALQDAVFAAAYRAHRAAQGELGSGADVAASTFGGLVLFEPRRRARPRTTPLALPRWATLLAAWTGTGAATEPLVRRYQTLDADRRRAFCRLSRGSVEWFAAALRQSAVSLAAFDAAGHALAELAATCGLPLFSERLRDLIAVARGHGAAAKPSGAGAGDCGIALTTNAAAAQRIREGWRSAGLWPLDLGVSSRGVTVASA